MGRRGAWFLSLALAAVLPARAVAQTPSPFYVGGSVGAFSVSGDNVDDRAPAVGVVGGAAVKPWLDVEAEFLIPTGDFKRSYTGISQTFAPPGSSFAEIERLGVVTRFDKTRHVDATISVLAVFHPRVTGRWTPALIAGVTNHRVQDRAVYTPVSVPESVDPGDPSRRVREEHSTRNIGGPTIGASLRIAITQRLAVVPDLRYDYGSIGDEINNTLRTSIRFLWSF
jgi:Outer membrane protein beta-barrel domain